MVGQRGRRLAGTRPHAKHCIRVGQHPMQRRLQQARRQVGITRPAIERMKGGLDLAGPEQHALLVPAVGLAQGLALRVDVGTLQRIEGGVAGHRDLVRHAPGRQQELAHLLVEHADAVGIAGLSNPAHLVQREQVDHAHGGDGHRARSQHGGTLDAGRIRRHQQPRLDCSKNALQQPPRQESLAAVARVAQRRFVRTHLGLQLRITQTQVSGTFLRISDPPHAGDQLAAGGQRRVVAGLQEVLDLQQRKASCAHRLRGGRQAEHANLGQAGVPHRSRHRQDHAYVAAAVADEQDGGQRHGAWKRSTPRWPNSNKPPSIAKTGGINRRP